MRAEEQTSQHLLLAVIVTVFSGLLGLIALFLSWEFWTIPLMTVACFVVWFLHIGRLGSNTLFDNLCAGLMLIEFFFFGVHESSLFDLPAVACILILALFVLNKKWILYAAAALYALVLAYHGLILRTISHRISLQDAFHLALGVIVTLGSTALALYWVNRRNAQRKRYDRIFAELESAGKQNAVFLSNVSHELRTPINMVIGISEVALGKELPPDIRADMSSIKMAGKRLSNQINNMLDVRIGCRRESYGINLIVDIRDTGIGMTSSQLTQMYDVFYQADSSSSRFAGGLGLGLPIAQGLLNAMGGFLHFASGEQEGLSAHIVIPQGVADERPCIELNHPEQLCIACYFRPEKYSCDEVREYYDGLIQSLVMGLGAKGYQVHNFEGLLKVQRSHKLTHVFIVQSEYMENPAYYEELAETIRVVVIAEREFNLSRESRLAIMHKPFSALSVANLLNGETGERGFAEDQAAGRKPFTCVGIRALAVDDEEMNLVVAKGVLGSYGIEVDTCLSGREAVAMCSGTSYDIVFLDHMMPGFDGVETLKKIRELKNGVYQDLPVIALTANTVSGAREMFRSEGFTEFVPKPIERTVLERVLRKVLPKSCIQYSERPTSKGAPVGAEAPSAEKVPAPQAAAAAPEAPAEVPEASGGPVPSYDHLAKAGVNTELGLDYCAGDESFYLEMLRMFCAQGPEKRAEIAALYESANWTDYAVKVHALKSTSLTIGAEALSAQAKELEMAGKRGDADFIRERHAALLRAHEALCAEIAGGL